jgi:hypothetical protein
MTDTNYTPSTQEVGAFLRARLVDAYGQPIDDFTTDSKPTKTQVETLITEAEDEVSQEIGTQVSAERINQAKRLTMLLAAANVELSYYPEQAAVNNSMYDKLMERYNTLLPKFGEDIGEDDQVQSSSFGGFPPSSLFGTRRW